MVMTPDQIRLKQNPVLSTLLLGEAKGNYVAQRLFPSLPQALSSVAIGTMGDERFRRYGLRRAPGAATHRVNIQYDGKIYSVDQYSVDIPIPRELIRESENAQKMNLFLNVDISKIAMATAVDILSLDYECQAAETAQDASNYAAGHTLDLSTTKKWSDPDGTPVNDIGSAVNKIRRSIGIRPNTLLLSYQAWEALRHNPQVRSYVSVTNTGAVSQAQAGVILDIPNIEIGDAVWKDEANSNHDIWGNSAILAYVPVVENNALSIAQPAFGFTNVMEGHPFAEEPYYENHTKTYVYGATFERNPGIVDNRAGFLFLNAN